MMLMDLLGKVGSILLLIGVLIICLVVITEKSAIQAAIAAIRGTQKVTKNVEANVREKVRQHQELRKKAEEEQRQNAAASQMEIHLNRVETQETPLVLEEAPDEEIPSFLRRKEPAAAQAPETKAPEAKPQGKKPIKDGILDIPLISYDEYRQKKEAHMAKTQAAALSEPERKEEPVMVYEPETVVEPVVREPVKEKVQTPNPAEAEKAIKKADPVTKEEQAKVSFGIQQNLFADQQGEQEYVFPSIDLLDKPKPPEMGGRDELYQNAQKLEKALLSFGVEATVTQVNQGPVVTRYELIPSQGVKVSRIVNLADDIALHLAAPAIRIEAPIPGKSAVGIEVPNKKPAMVSLREIIESDVFRKYPSKVAFSLGKAIDGEIKVTNIASMPHLLIAGATGSGKSVCINALLISILYKAHPRDVKLILVDPKVVELSVYNGIPHLLLPVVNDPKKAAAALNWAVQEMNDRYKKFADMNVRDLKGYNEAVRKRALEGELMETLPQIVIVVDELADLMMVAGKEVETAITRLGQMARAAGMHLVLATQRPSVDVINGVIKANIPSRLAFAVSSGVDSKTILDTVGAENLLGKGDMLFQPSGQQATRIQG
ncbi:MAG: DNA translocase FtsK, partial [Firmicutes bacterium]|nr:DNA translocase FtsK [Bacillota bacterium]